MRHVMLVPIALAVALIVALICGTAAAEEEAVPPIESGVEETAEVRLVLLDTVVVDRDGRTVPDLTRDDFEVVSGGDLVAVDTLDVFCEAGALDDPRGVRRAANREPVPPAEEPRKIVLAFDYLHLGMGGRELAFQQAAHLLDAGGTAGDEVLVAALTGGLRIEQTFSDDPEDLRETLRRMRYDVTLWNGNFRHQDERGFVGGLTALLDVLGTVPGRKAVVLFSEMQDVPLDGQFQDIAAIAAASRCSIYPVDAGGLRPPRGFGDAFGVGGGGTGFG